MALAHLPSVGMFLFCTKARETRAFDRIFVSFENNINVYIELVYVTREQKEDRDEEPRMTTIDGWTRPVREASACSQRT